MTTAPAPSADPRRRSVSRWDSSGPPTALVVDDSPVDSQLVGSLLEKHLGLHLLYAASGPEALALLERETPGIVITDLRMEQMDGLQLVDAIRARHPAMPVVLITAFGSEDSAVQALRRGASSYVAKRHLARDLVDTVDQVLAAARMDRRRQRLLECLTRAETCFELENDPTLIPCVVHHFQEYLFRLGVCDPGARTRVGIALEEALLNGLYHGNLEISSDLRQRDDTAFYELAAERRRQLPYSRRRLHVRARLSREEALFVIRDEGPGFDPGAQPDPTDPANCAKLSGRGLLLIRTFMDEVHYNAAGNEITMIKRCVTPEE